MKVLVLGASGMLGHQLFKNCLRRNIKVYGVVRKKKLLLDFFGSDIEDKLLTISDAKSQSEISRLIYKVNPDYVINCIGIVKQANAATKPMESIAINSLLPHFIADLAHQMSFRFIHISTDCVFDGKKGNYSLDDRPSAIDLYGRSKHLGEVDYGNSLTLRTSIIGHELSSPYFGLLEWFLSQSEEVSGFDQAIFSGLTTLELSKVILDLVIPQKLKPAVYQVASDPISKYDLLKIISTIYEKNIRINRSNKVIIDRSLDGSYFSNLTNYSVPAWTQLITDMRDDRKGYLTTIE